MASKMTVILKENISCLLSIYLYIRISCKQVVQSIWSKHYYYSNFIYCSFKVVYSGALEWRALENCQKWWNSYSVTLLC